MEITRPDDSAARLFGTVRPTAIEPYTRVAVRPTDACFVCQAGRILGQLAGGTHEFTPSAQPFLAEARPGPLDLVFVTVGPIAGQPFGTATPIPIRDPSAAEPVRVRLVGSYSIQVVDPQKLAQAAMGGAEAAELDGRIRNQLLMALGSAVGQAAATGELTAATLDKGLIALAPGVARQASTALADLGIRVAGVEQITAHAHETVAPPAAVPAAAPAAKVDEPRTSKKVFVLAGCLLSLALGGLVASVITIAALIVAASM